MAMIGALLGTKSATLVDAWDILPINVSQNRTFPIDSDKLSPKMWAEYIEFEFGRVQIKLDTGAEVNVMPKCLLDKLIGKNYKLKPTPIILEVYSGARLRPLGSITFDNCTLNGISIALDFIVAEVESVPLLSLEACEQYNLINRVINKSSKPTSNVFQVSINACETAMLTYPNQSKQPYAKFNQSPKVTSTEESLENDSAFKQIILDNPDVFSKDPGCFPNLYSIEVDPSKKPVAIPSRRVPLTIKDRYQSYLQKLCSQEIIKKCSNPRGYISPIVIVEKPDSSLRICLDPKHLNEALCRPFYQIPSIEDISALLTNKKYFTVLDLTTGFWHCKLTDSSSELCKFSTPFGIYQFLRLPFGLSVSPEIFQQAVNDVFGSIDGIVMYFDDLLIVADSEEKHDLIFQAVIQRARENNVHFNPDKIQYKKTSVKFLGHIFSQWGKSVDPDRIEAIKKLKNPTNIKELQRLLGIVNHLREFVPNLADDTACLTQLMKKNVHFEWLPFHSDALDSIKDKICLNISLVVFDPKKSIEIQCDSSQNGIGTCLMQNGRPVSFASRSLTQSERNYAQIEKELLAIVYSVQKFHYYLYGQKSIVVYSDHKPLIPIFKQPLSEVSSKRLARLLLKTLAYDLKVQHVPGKLMHIADALSRDFLPCQPNDEVLMTQVHSVSSVIVTNVEKQYAKETLSDETLQQVIDFYNNGWPNNSRSLNNNLKKYFAIRNELTVEDNLVYFKNRLVIPNSLQHSTLIQLHSGHQKIVKSKALAQQTVFWPGINSDLEAFVAKCSVCAEVAPSQKKLNMIQHDIPDLPWWQIAVDILEYKGLFYLVVIDYYSKWIDAILMKDKTAHTVVDILSFLFSVHGVPKVLFADNNPFKSYVCTEFAEQQNFTIVTCSPHFHQSNGLAERAVGIVKSFLKKCFRDPKATLQNCLLQYRITPIAGLGASPAQLLMSRQLRSSLPIHVSKLKPAVIPNVKTLLTQKSNLTKQHYDKTANSKECTFSPSDYVFMQNPFTKEWEPGIIVEKCDEPRSYFVKNSGTSRVVRRNVKFLKPNPSSQLKPYCTPVYMLPAASNNVPVNQIPIVNDNEIPQNNADPNLNQNVLNLNDIDDNLERWREQIRNRMENVPVNRTRTRVIKKPDRLNL